MIPRLQRVAEIPCSCCVLAHRRSGQCSVRQLQSCATQALADNQQKAFADCLPCVVAFNSHSVVITTHLHCNSCYIQFCSDSSLLLAADAAALGHKGTYTVGLMTHNPGLITHHIVFAIFLGLSLLDHIISVSLFFCADCWSVQTG